MIGKTDDLEVMMAKLGDFGLYQLVQFILQVVSSIATSVQMFSLVTVAAVPEHRCWIDGLDSQNYSEPWNSSLIKDAIPMDAQGNLNSCFMYGENETMVECQSWVYDTQYYSSSRGIEWNFVCSRRWMGAIAQVIFMLGVVLGSCILVPLSDKFGRKTIFVWTGTFQLITGIIVAFSTNYYMFVVLRFLYGIFAISPFKSAFVLNIELIGSSKRAVCSAFFQVLFGFGVILVSVWAYFIDNRFYLQIIYACHAILLLPQWFLMDESPRWLWAKGRIRESTKIVSKALKMNKSTETVNLNSLMYHYKIEKEVNKGTSPLDLCRTPNMFKRSTIICGCFFAVAVVYYGLSFNAINLRGHPHLMVFVSGLVEIPGYALSMVFVNRLGHRALLSSTMLLSGITLLTVIVLPVMSVAAIVSAMIGKFTISASFAVVYKYGAELFPTVVRSTGMGIATMFASLSAALIPLITLLDSFNPKTPIVIFALTAIFFGVLSLFLPETLGKLLPQTLEDGEYFGVGDTCFSNCMRRKESVDNDDIEEIKPLQISSKT